MLQRSLSLILCFILCFIVSCASDPGPLAPIQEPDSPSVGPEGGAIQGVAGNGATLTVEVPAGAVLTTTPITLTAVDGAEKLARFRVQPAGLRFRAPVTLTFTEPDGVVLDDYTRITMGPEGDAVTLATEIDAAAGTASVTTWLLGFETDSPSKDGFGFLNLEQIDCQLQLANVEQRLLIAQQFMFSVDSTQKLALEFKAAQQCLGDLDPGAFTLVEAAIQNAACDAQQDAIAQAALEMADVLDPVNEIEKLRGLISPILGSEAARVLTDAPCGTSGTAIPEIASSYTKFAENFKKRVEAPGFLQGNPWFILWQQEMKLAFELQGDAALLGIEEVETQTQSELLPAMYDQFRRAAYEACENDNTQQYLADVMTAGHLYGHPIETEPEVPLWANFTSDDVAQDIQYCQSRLEVEIYDALSQPISEQWVTLEGTAPGEFTHEAQVTVPADGFIDLSGSISALYCYDPTGISMFETDPLLLQINGTTVQDILPQGGVMLTSPVDLSVEQTLESIGLPITENQSFQIQLVRSGSSCDGAYGEPSPPLFSIDVETTNTSASLRLELEAPPLEYAYLTFPIELVVTEEIDDPGEPDKQPPAFNLDVMLTVEGGTLSSESGVTDEEGRFTTQLTLDPEATEVTLNAVVTTLDDIEFSQSITRPVLRGRVAPGQNISRSAARASAVVVNFGPGHSPPDQVANAVDFESFAGTHHVIATWANEGGSASASSQTNYQFDFELNPSDGGLRRVYATGDNTLTAQAQDAAAPPGSAGASCQGWVYLQFDVTVEDHPVRLAVAANLAISARGQIDAMIRGPEPELLLDLGSVPVIQAEQDYVLLPGDYEFGFSFWAVADHGDGGGNASLEVELEFE